MILVNRITFFLILPCPKKFECLFFFHLIRQLSTVQTLRSSSFLSPPIQLLSKLDVDISLPPREISESYVGQSKKKIARANTVKIRIKFVKSRRDNLDDENRIAYPRAPVVVFFWTDPKKSPAS